MRWFSNMSENIKRGIRSWLDVQSFNPYTLRIREMADFELNAIRNRIWYRGDSNEIEQLYEQMNEYADKYKFWASKCTEGMEIRKIHTGLPGLIVDVLTEIVYADMNDFEFKSSNQQQIWKEIEKKNKFRRRFKRNLKDVLYIGDGAYKIIINTKKSDYPILRWYPGDRIEFVYDGDEIEEIIFKTPYSQNNRQYVLHERYGGGYIKYELYREDKQVNLKELKKTEDIKNWEFDNTVMLAVPLKVFENKKFEGRGGSIFDGKLDDFDSFDEAWSQWMDALRAGRAKTYVPESYIPRNPETGKILKPNPFDNRFIAGDDNMGENGKNVITTEQPSIPHDSYLATYCTALDLCLQGIISPSTLGIDVKKLDNADAQREKEKATLYTRNAIVEALQEELPELINTVINTYNILNNKTIEEVEVDIPFGEYANPSFESQVETVSKGKQGGIMSIEASVEELYGDSRDESWKKEEIARLKAEQGIAEVNEPEVRSEAAGFTINMEESDESKGNDKNLSDEPKGISGTSEGSK